MDEKQPIRVIPTEAYFAMVRRQLSESGHAYVRVTGMSMWPLLRHLTDGVIIVPPDRVRLGDIVLFDRKNGRYTLHRVVMKEKKGFSMAGDHQWHVERGLPYGQIMGVVSILDRNGRRIPCESFFLKFYAWTVTALTFPRIHLGKLVRKLIGLFRRRRAAGQKGNCNEDQA